MAVTKLGGGEEERWGKSNCSSCISDSIRRGRWLIGVHSEKEECIAEEKKKKKRFCSGQNRVTY